MSSSNNKHFPRILYISSFLLLLLLSNSEPIQCGGRKKRIRHSAPTGKAKQMAVNLTANQVVEQQYMRWVQFVGRLKHSVFRSAKNKLFASYTLVVDKNPAVGDFTTIQDAIDSLPAVNLVRVIIKVHAGVYT